MIQELRIREYRSRKDRIHLAEKQRVSVKDEVARENLHIVYVMTHVSVCGGVKVIFEHANHLSRRGVRVTILSHFVKPEWFPIEADYVQVPFGVELAKGIPVCDMIVATYWDHIQACVETGIAPVVYFEQGDFHLFDHKNMAPDVAKFVRKQFELPHRIITVSGKAAKLIKNLYGRDSDVFHNAIDTSIFRAEGDRYISSNPYVLMLGSDNTKFKGLDDILAAYRSLKESGLAVDLVWITPNQPATVDPLIKEVFVNPPQEKIAELYRGAAVYISGSYYESFSLPVLEAMACACPVVTTANEGVKEYAVHAENCLMTAPGTPVELSRHTRSILEDGSLRDKLVANGLKAAGRFEWNQIITKLVDFYEDESSYEPQMIQKIDDWDISIELDQIMKHGDQAKLYRMLKTTKADQIIAPAIYPLMDGIDLARWETIASRKNSSGERVERLYCEIVGNRLEHLPYKDAYILFRQGEYLQAANAFAENAAGAASFESMRWVALCLIKLEQYDEACKFLNELQALYPDNTDVYYLFMMIPAGTQHIDKANVIQLIHSIGEAVGYPEYFRGITNGIEVQEDSANLTPQRDKLKISLITNTASGCNATILYKALPAELKAKYEVRLVQEKRYEQYDDFVKNSDVIITTHGNYPYNDRQISIDLWHGFPIKGVANMDPGDPHSPEQIMNHWRNVDIVASYSSFFNTVINACRGSKINQYRITGSPRNDMLFRSDSKATLSRLLGVDVTEKRVAYYMPTFREVFFDPNRKEGQRHWNNLFSFGSFDNKKFTSFLEENNMVLVVKLHPVEESIVLKQVSQLKNKGVFLLTNEMLHRHNTDLYEVLGGSDLLITDYSSVHFDYLLINKPMIFTPTDYDAYSKRRGFLLEPYDFWTPGPKATDQLRFQEEIVKSLNDPMYYEQERRTVSSIIHKFQDDQSSIRVWKMIDEAIEQGQFADKTKKKQIASELLQLQSDMKSKIKVLIESGQLEQAKQIIVQYEQLVDHDIEIITMKSAILYVEQNFDEAIEVLLTGLALNDKNFEVLYNLAFIYDGMGKYPRAQYYYEKAAVECKDTELLNLIQESVARIKQQEKNQVRE